MSYELGQGEAEYSGNGCHMHVHTHMHTYMNIHAQRQHACTHISLEAGLRQEFIG